MTTPAYPHVTILYQSESTIRAIIAHPSGVEWTFGAWQERPASDLPTLLSEAMRMGATVINADASASSGKPIVIIYRIPAWFALNAVSRLERAITAAPKGAGETRRVRR